MIFFYKIVNLILKNKHKILYSMEPTPASMTRLTLER